MPDYIISSPTWPDATITVEPASEPTTIETYDDGTWVVNGEEWTEE